MPDLIRHPGTDRIPDSAGMTRVMDNYETVNIMLKKDESKIHPSRPAASILFSIVLVTLLEGLLPIGCAGNFGRLEQSRQATSLFKSYQVLDDHRYYFAGPDGWPDAIIAVQNDFTLLSDQWTLFNATPDRLKQLMSWTESHFGMNTRYHPYGYEILAPGGRRIGMWYSIWDWTVIEMLGPQEVRIYPPKVKDLIDGGDGQDSAVNSD